MWVRTWCGLWCADGACAPQKTPYFIGLTKVRISSRLARSAHLPDDPLISAGTDIPGLFIPEKCSTYVPMGDWPHSIPYDLEKALEELDRLRFSATDQDRWGAIREWLVKHSVPAPDYTLPMQPERRGQKFE